MTVKNIEKLVEIYKRILNRAKRDFERYLFRLDLLNLDFNWALKSFRSYPLIVKKDAILKTIVIEGEGSPKEALDLLSLATRKLKETKCRVISARIRNVTNDCYASVLSDGRIIRDTCPVTRI